MNRRHLIAIAAVAGAGSALAAPVGAQAASCFKELPGPNGKVWTIQHDGSQALPLSYENGSNFDQHHGKLTVNGADYPGIGDQTCATTETKIEYPFRTIGGMLVRREVASVGGRIRRMDTIINDTDVEASVDVDFAVRVQGSQVAIESESGDAAVTSDDHWSVHENDGGSNPFLQWGDDQAPTQPDVVSLGNVPASWQQQAGAMPDADLVYENIVVAPNSTIRLLHVSGTTGSASASETQAENGATPFSDMTVHEAAQVVNWGPDPDGDGVTKLSDECPGIAGNNAKGCLLLLGIPFEPDEDDGSGGGGSGGGDDTPPAPAEAPAVVPPAPAPPAPLPAPVARDTKAPGVKLTRLARTVKRSRLTRGGLAPRVDCDEACSVRVQVKTRKRGSRRASTVLTKKLTSRSAAARTVRLKLSSRSLRRLGRQQVTLVVTVSDATGNRRAVTRVVRLAR